LSQQQQQQDDVISHIGMVNLRSMQLRLTGHLCWDSHFTVYGAAMHFSDC
jgi:hypothetical protein